MSTLEEAIEAVEEAHHFIACPRAEESIELEHVSGIGKESGHDALLL